MQPAPPSTTRRSWPQPSNVAAGATVPGERNAVNIEKLDIAKIAQRVWTAEGWGNDEPSLSEGHLVTAAVRETVRSARAREDALLEALKYCLNSLDAYGFGGTLIDTQRAVVRQIEGTR